MRSRSRLSNPVITSYSIHYTKLYDDGAAAAIPAPNEPGYIDIYDYAALTEHGIATAAINEHAEIVNRPQDVWERHSNISYNFV